MARTQTTVNKIIATGTGLTPVAQAAVDVANGNYCRNNGKTWLEVTNTNGAAQSRVLTVHFNRKVAGQTVTPKTYTLAAGASRRIGPFDPANYGGLLNFNGDHAELTVAAYTV